MHLFLDTGSTSQGSTQIGKEAKKGAGAGGRGQGFADLRVILVGSAQQESLRGNASDFLLFLVAHHNHALVLQWANYEVIPSQSPLFFV